METKFTPGPWRMKGAIKPDNVGGWDFAVLDGDNRIIAEAYGIVGEASGKLIERPAFENARLIAAAPDLYEAVQYITRWLMTDVDALPPHVTRDDVRVYHLDGAVLSNCLERARAALSKARGESQ